MARAHILRSMVLTDKGENSLHTMDQIRLWSSFESSPLSVKSKLYFHTFFINYFATFKIRQLLRTCDWQSGFSSLSDLYIVISCPWGFFQISELPIIWRFQHFILNGLKKSSRTLANSILQPIIKVPYSHLNPEKLKIKRTNYLNALFNAKYRLLLLILSTIVFVFPFYTLILSFSFISTNGYFCLDVGKRSKNLT